MWKVAEDGGANPRHSAVFLVFGTMLADGGDLFDSLLGNGRMVDSKKARIKSILFVHTRRMSEEKGSGDELHASGMLSVCFPHPSVGIAALFPSGLASFYRRFKL